VSELSCRFPKPNWLSLVPTPLLEMQVELSCRVAVLLVRLHHRQIVATPAVRPTLAKVKELLHAEIKRKKDVLGFNLAATNHLLRTLKQQRMSAF